MRFFRLLFILTTIAALLFNSLSFTSSLLLICATALSILYTNRYKLNGNYARYLVYFVIWISVIFMPSFHLVEPIMARYEPVTNEMNNRLLSFGIPLYAITIFVQYFVTIAFPKHKNHAAYFTLRMMNERHMLFLLVFGIFLSLFCLYTGIGRMGGESVYLPFHLSGIINMYRAIFFPCFFAVFVENYSRITGKIPKKHFVLFIIWCFIEIFAWLSKSVLIKHLLPSLLVVFFIYKPSFKKIAKYTLPLLLAFIFLYPIIEIMRNEDTSTSLIDSFNNSRNEVKNEETDGLLKPLNRTFMFGAQFVQNYSYLNLTDLFDFSKLPVLFVYGGSAGYQTFAIDGFPEGNHHSSGTSGIMDPLLHGGIGLLYIVIGFLLILATWIDTLFLKNYVCIASILLVMLIDYVAFANVSMLYNEDGFQQFISYVLSLFIAFYINFKRQSNKSRKGLAYER